MRPALVRGASESKLPSLWPLQCWAEAASSSLSLAPVLVCTGQGWEGVEDKTDQKGAWWPWVAAAPALSSGVRVGEEMLGWLS